MIELSFTPPPSTNALYSGRRYRTERYRHWQESVGWEIVTSSVLANRKHRIAGPFALSVWLPPGIDLDNIKAIADLLGPGKHGLGITEDDRRMVELHVYRDKEAKQCRVRIEARA